MDGFGSEKETDKWASPSQLNAEAITLLSKSGYFPCFILLACCHADLGLPQNILSLRLPVKALFYLLAYALLP